MRVEWESLEGKTNILEGIRRMVAPKGKDENEDYKIVETLLCQVNVKGVPLVSEFPHQRKDVSNQIFALDEKTDRVVRILYANDFSSFFHLWYSFYFCVATPVYGQYEVARRAFSSSFFSPLLYFKDEWSITSGEVGSRTRLCRQSRSTRSVQA